MWSQSGGVGVVWGVCLCGLIQCVRVVCLGYEILPCYLCLNLLCLSHIYNHNSLCVVCLCRALNLAVVANTAGEEGICDPSALSTTQERICAVNRDVVYSIAQGVGVGLVQCGEQFSTRRWNCSVDPAHYSYFLTATQQGETVVQGHR